MRMLPGMVCSAALLVACSGDGGTGPNGTFHLNDVSFVYTEIPEGVSKPSVFFFIGWANCPSDMDCNEDLSIEVSGAQTVVDLGPPSGWMNLPPEKLDALEQLFVSGPNEMTLEWTLDNGVTHAEGVWGPIVCPAMFNLTAPAPTDVVATPGPLTVSWTPFERVAPDSGQILAANSSAVTAIEWDDDLNTNNGVVQNKQVTADATSVTLDLAAKYPISDRLLVHVTAAGRVFEDPLGGEGSCNIARSVIVDLQ